MVHEEPLTVVQFLEIPVRLHRASKHSVNAKANEVVSEWHRHQLWQGWTMWCQCTVLVKVKMPHSSDPSSTLPLILLAFH